MGLSYSLTPSPILTTYPGIGVFRWDDHGQYYAGDWKDGKQNGNGVMRFPNGGIYEGKQHNIAMFVILNLFLSTPF